MKRTIAFLLSALLVLSLCACGGAPASSGSSDEAGTAVTELKTLNDAFRAAEDGQSVASWDSEHYVYCFYQDGAATRVAADLTPELEQQIDDVLFSGDSDSDAQLVDLIGDLPLSIVEDLTPAILPQDQLDALAGKTGKDLLDDGWVINGSYWSEDDVLAVLLDNGMFSYQINFDQDVERGDDFDVEAGIQNLTVQSAELFGLGDMCTDLSITA